MKDEIEKLREKINKIEIQIEELVKNKWNDYNFEHKIGYWDCKESPIEICVYNRFEDPVSDHCLFCFQPHERK